MRGVAFGLDAIHPSIPPSAPCSIKAVNGGRSDEERKKEGGKTRNETMMANKGAARCTNGPRARAQAQASSSVRMHIYTHTRGGGGGGAERGCVCVCMCGCVGGKEDGKITAGNATATISLNTGPSVPLLSKCPPGTINSRPKSDKIWYAMVGAAGTMIYRFSKNRHRDGTLVPIERQESHSAFPLYHTRACMRTCHMNQPGRQPSSLHTGTPELPKGGTLPTSPGMYSCT